MNQDERTHFENLILLRSSGELNSAEEARFDAAIAEDAELAAFAETLERLSLHAHTTRDFAAEAIAEVMHEPAPRDFAAQAIQRTSHHQPRRSYQPWIIAVAAAVVLMFSITSLLQPSPPALRRTVTISQQLDAIEQELIVTPRTRLHRQHPSI